jgi:hypothetical protein
MKVHPSLTVDRVLEAVQREATSLDNPGFCTACGEEADDCEPDARKCRCASCGQHAVYGAQELLIMMAP